MAVLEHHVSSSGGGFTNIYSQARITYYGISGIPNSFFDGITNVLGGSTGTYSQFLTKYNQRIAVQSHFTIDLNGSHSGLNYNVTATIEKIGTYTGSNLVFQLVTTESNLSYSGDIYNHVTRLMSPNANGTALNFTSGNIQTVNLNFNVNASWVLANCELVAFVQNNTTKEVLQTIKLPINDLQILGADAALTGVYNLPLESCLGLTSPVVQLKNLSTSNVFSAVIKYGVNNETLYTYNWSGNLSLNQVQNVSLPEIGFTVESVNDFKAYLFSTNGIADLNPLNDTTVSSFIEASTYNIKVNLEIFTDNNPNQTTWQFKNSAGTVIASGGPYTGQANTLIQQVINFNETGCYRFVINDSGGNGICCASGNGYYELTDTDGEIIQQGGNFGTIETTEFYMSGITLNATVLLEGPFDYWSYAMNTDLNQKGLIPLTQPFNLPPWNYNGTESVVSVPNFNIVDWVLVEIRETPGDASTATEQTIVARQAAFVHTYGYLVGLDGVSPLRFDIGVTDNLYLVIWHRNHIGIMSSQPVTASGGIYNYDFSIDVSQIYGGAAGCKDILNTGVWGMAAGDMNADGQIDGLDKNTIWTPQAGSGSYLSGDINLDGQTDNSDKNELYPENFNIITCHVPTEFK